MKNKKAVGSLVWRIIIILLLAALILLAVKPEWVPFIGEDMAQSISLSLKSTFFRSDDGGAGLLTLPTLISMVAVIVVVSLVATVIRFVLEKLSLKKNRSKTVAGLVISVTKYAAWLICIVWCLSLAGVNITGIFASLGILSLVIGFGAQSLIEDVITGVFIIFEGQYNVGDIIILDDFRGTVARIGVRTTNVVDAGGNVKIVNNSDIRNVQNRSQNPSWAVCDVGISYAADIEAVEKVLEKNLPIISEKEPKYFLEPIRYRGVQELGGSAVVLRLVGKVNEADIFNAERFMRREVKILFDKNNIEIPFLQVVLHEGDKGSKKK